MKYHTFCAANSGNGFVSLFDQLLDEKKQYIYYLKGGPGCGKSTLLKKIANQFSDAELILCSGDPTSLDGVILPKIKTIVIDATAPHAYEPTYPGTGGSIINLGEAWELQKIDKNKVAILSDQKKPLYKSAYNLLNAAKSLQSEVSSLLYPFINFKDIENYVVQILCQNGLSQQNEWNKMPETRFLSAISAEGCINANQTFKKLGKNMILLHDSYKISHYFLKIVKKILDQWKIHYLQGLHPLHGSNVIQHIIIPSVNLSFITDDGQFNPNLNEDDIFKKIDLKKFINILPVERNRNKIVFFQKTSNELMNAAVENLMAARSIHFEIEAEYHNGTQFEITEMIGEKLINKLRDLS